MEGGSSAASEARFVAYVEALGAVLGHADRQAPMRDYCLGLLMPIARKSVEPMAAVTAPAQVAAKHQSLLHLVGNAPWSDAAMLARVGQLVLPAIERSGPIEAWIIDDTGFPKKGRHSVGVTRQIITDTLRLLVGAEIHPADVQDRDGAALVVGATYDLFPWLRHLFADSAYSGGGLDRALAKFGRWTIEVIRRSADVAGFAVLPRRWVVERTLAWLNRNRRLSKDFDASLASAKAWLYLGSIQLLIRRLARA